MKKYIGINTSFGHNIFDNYDEYDFRTDISLHDYDAIILSTYFVTSNYKCETTDYMGYESRTFQGIKVLNQDDSFIIVREYEKIKKQLQDILNNGKNVFVFLDKNEKRYIYSGETSTNGTGKNAKETNYVKLINENGFLPLETEFEDLSGERIQPIGNGDCRDFLDSMKGFFSYEMVINKPQGIEFAVIPGTNKVISMYMRYGKGNIVFLPRPYEVEEYHDDEVGQIKRKELLKKLMELDEKLTITDEETELPAWAKEIELIDERKYREKNEIIDKKIQNLSIQKAKNTKKLEEIETYKRLLTETGINLENIIQNVLCELGFELENSEINRTDIIGNYKGIPIVFEIKGVTKSAGERNAAQLEKWISDYHVNKGVKPKGVLMVNAFREKPIMERTEPVFPKQMLDYSIRREHCLISTTQFLCMFIDCRNNKKNKEIIIREFIRTIGVYNKYNEKVILGIEQ